MMYFINVPSRQESVWEREKLNWKFAVLAVLIFVSKFNLDFGVELLGEGLCEQQQHIVTRLNLFLVGVWGYAIFNLNPKKKDLVCGNKKKVDYIYQKQKNASNNNPTWLNEINKIFNFNNFFLLTNWRRLLIRFISINYCMDNLSIAWW